MFKSLVWLDPKKIPAQAGFEPGTFRSRGRCLTTRPTRRSDQVYKPPNNTKQTSKKMLEGAMVARCWLTSLARTSSTESLANCHYASPSPSLLSTDTSHQRNWPWRWQRGPLKHDAGWPSPPERSVQNLLPSMAVTLYHPHYCHCQLTQLINTTDLEEDGEGGHCSKMLVNQTGQNVQRSGTLVTVPTPKMHHQVRHNFLHTYMETLCNHCA